MMRALSRISFHVCLLEIEVETINDGERNF